MAFVITKGQTFGSTEQITNTKLHALVDSATISIASQAQGDIIYHNGTDWVRLAAGTSGYYLKTQGASANPTWAAVSVPAGYVYRNNPTDWDVTESSLTTDGNWHDLDLSSIVPAGATGIIIKVYLYDNDVAYSFALRKNGDTGGYNTSSTVIQVTNTVVSQDCIVGCDTGRVVEYLATNGTWSQIKLVVKGWFL